MFVITAAAAAADDENEFPVTYKIADQMGEKIEGTFHEEELQSSIQQTDRHDRTPLSLRRSLTREERTIKGRTEQLVKHENYDDKFNQWISEKQLADLKP